MSERGNGGLGLGFPGERKWGMDSMVLEGWPGRQRTGGGGRKVASGVAFFSRCVAVEKRERKREEECGPWAWAVSAAALTNCNKEGISSL